MARTYRLGRRAERQAETRQRIVEAAVELHTTLGPARTSVSAIAARAGVQRHTYYSHFPEERDLHLACSGLHFERNPLPDPETWRGVDDPDERLRRALGEVYLYYAEHEQLLANVTRDAQGHPLVAEIAAERFGPPVERMVSVLAEGSGVRGRGRARLLAALGLALDFATWRSLCRRGGLSDEEAVEVMVGAAACARRRRRRARAAPAGGPAASA